MLKQRFSRSSSRENSYDSRSLSRPAKSKGRNTKFYDEHHKNGENRLAPTVSGNVNATSATNSANVTPEMIRRAYAPELRNEAPLR